MNYDAIILFICIVFDIMTNRIIIKQIRNIYKGYTRLKQYTGYFFKLQNIAFSKQSGIFRLVLTILLELFVVWFLIHYSIPHYLSYMPVIPYMNHQLKVNYYMTMIVIYITLFSLAMSILLHIIIFILKISEHGDRAVLTKTDLISFSGVFTKEDGRFVMEEEIADRSGTKEVYIKAYIRSGKREKTFRFRILNPMQIQEIKKNLKENF